MGKSRDLTEFERGLIVGARSAGCSISETVNRLGFSKTAVSRIYREWCVKKKTSSLRGTGGRKRLVDEVGERRMERVVEANNRATVTEIQTMYNFSAETPISHKTTQRALKRLGYSRKPPRRDSVSRTTRKNPVPRTKQQDPVQGSPLKEQTAVSTDLGGGNNAEQDTGSKTRETLPNEGAPVSCNQTLPGVEAPLPGFQCW